MMRNYGRLLEVLTMEEIEEFKFDSADLDRLIKRFSGTDKRVDRDIENMKWLKEVDMQSFIIELGYKFYKKEIDGRWYRPAHGYEILQEVDNIKYVKESEKVRYQFADGSIGRYMTEVVWDEETKAYYKRPVRLERTHAYVECAKPKSL